MCFHPHCSESSAAIRGSKPLVRNGNYYFWEVTVFDKTYGTSVMFGLCNKKQRLHVNDYLNFIGLDENGWSLSHKGLIWHGGKCSRFTPVFPEHQTVTVGLLFNTMRGELSFFLNGNFLGVAFTNLNSISDELYPVVGSTAKRTRMRLTGAYCGHITLRQLSCYSISKHANDPKKLVEQMEEKYVPKPLVNCLAVLTGVCQ